MQTTTLLTPPAPPYTVAPMAKEKLLTGAEAFNLGLKHPFELVHGKIVLTDYSGDEHGIIESELSRHLGNFNVTRKLGWVLSGEVGVYTRYEPDTVRGVDVIFISRQRLAAPKGKALQVAPELVVEIVSPNDRWGELRAKIAEYFAIGVERVWIVEPEKKQLLVYRTPTDFIQLTEQESVRGEGILEGFTLSLHELFADLP
ncbi:MAG: Uma2 family endonuclease [Caldilinea sp. CFX5]|nr:Uma2 family endonuclease [Caldilinea sp. CFX5]